MMVFNNYSKLLSVLLLSIKEVLNEYSKLLILTYIEMERDSKTELTVPLVRNKPAEMDVMDYVSSVQSTTIKNENELFFQVSLIKN